MAESETGESETGELKTGEAKTVPPAHTTLKATSHTHTKPGSSLRYIRPGSSLRYMYYTNVHLGHASGTHIKPQGHASIHSPAPGSVVDLELFERQRHVAEEVVESEETAVEDVEVDFLPRRPFRYRPATRSNVSTHGF